MKIKPVYFLFVLIISTVSCSFDPIEFKSIDDLEFGPNGKDGQAITATLTLHNPNGYSFTIRDVDIDVYLKQAYLGKLEINDTVTVNKRSDFTTTGVINVKREHLFVAGAALLGSIGKKELQLNLKGKMGIEYFIFNKDIQIDHKEKVKL